MPLPVSLINANPPGVNYANDTTESSFELSKLTNRVYCIVPVWSLPVGNPSQDITSFDAFIDLYCVDGVNHRVHSSALWIKGFFNSGGETLTIVPIPMTAAQKTLFVTTSVTNVGYSAFTRLKTDSGGQSTIQNVDSYIVRLNNNFSMSTSDRMYPNTVSLWRPYLSLIDKEPGIVVVPVNGMYPVGTLAKTLFSVYPIYSSLYDAINTECATKHVLFLDSPIPAINLHRLIDYHAITGYQAGLFDTASGNLEPNLIYSKQSNYSTATWDSSTNGVNNDTTSLNNVTNFIRDLKANIGFAAKKSALFYDWLYEDEPEFRYIAAPNSLPETSKQNPASYESGDIYDIKIIPPSAFAAAGFNNLAKTGQPFNTPAILPFKQLYFEPIDRKNSLFATAYSEGCNFFGSATPPVLSVKNQLIINSRGIVGVKTNGFNVLDPTTKTELTLRSVSAHHSAHFITYACSEVLKQFVFQLMSPVGTTLQTISSVCSVVLNILYNMGALRGDTSVDSFFAKVDEENNPPYQIEAGVVMVDIYVVLPVTLERILIETLRVAIGDVAAVQASQKQATSDVLKQVNSGEATEEA
jgi:hypothetical protein